MARNLIVLSDGTGNSSAKLFKTNVWRVYEALDLNGSGQIAIYDDGVGTASNKYLAMLGGAFGIGLKRNVLRLYRFLCRNYRTAAENADGAADRIYAFGFSRGAFTIRVLVGLINSEGLVPADDERALKRYARQAYRVYREKSYERGVSLALVGRGLRDAWLKLWYAIRSFERYEDVARREFDKEHDRPFRFLGLWDTVDAYGLPVDELTHAVDKWIWPLEFNEYRLCPLVERACHALSLDDERTSFHPVLWDERGQAPATNIADQRISQVWFAGVHSNVGGGYPDDRLSFVSLRWIMNEALKAGLVFNPHSWTHLHDQETILGRLYDSRQGFGGYYRYQPRHVETLSMSASNPMIHESVLRRIVAGVDGYGPVALPGRFDVVTAAGDIVPAAPFIARLPNGATLNLPNDAASGVAWDFVWWRRICYFATLLISLPLLLFPLIVAWEFAPNSKAGQLAATSEDIASGLLGRVFDVIDAVLPSFLTTWTAAFRQKPILFLSIVILLVISMRISSALQRRIRGGLRAAWVPAAATAPPRSKLVRRALDRARALSAGFARLVRTSPCVGDGYEVLTGKVLPFVFAILIIVAGVHAANRVVFEVISAAGGVCEPKQEEDSRELALNQSSGPIEFATNDPCLFTGIRLTKDAQYRIDIAVKDKWVDESIPSDGAKGFRSPASHPVMWTAVPMRRHLFEPWFQPFARIGAYGRDEYALAARSTRITARKDGPLYLFVNDALLISPRWITGFYDNNKGTAEITVTKIEDPPKM